MSSKYKPLKEQVKDALYYLNKPGQSPGDEQKAVEILEHIADYRSSNNLLENIKQSDVSSVLDPDVLKGKYIAVIPGHQPGGGAKGERTYNKIVAKEMVRLLEEAGANVLYYEHRYKSYSSRQNAMCANVNKLQPNNQVCLELHYDAVSYSSAHGHHFKYVSTKGKKLASAIRDRFQARYPQKRALRDKGIELRKTGNGSGFLIKAPGVACLTEPFFRSNPVEWEFFKDKQKELALVYCLGIQDYFSA